VETNIVESKQSLRKFFLLLLTWLITIIAIFAGSIFYDQQQASEYDVSAVPYLKVIIPEISKWDPATTKSLMATDVATDISEEKFAQAMIWFAKLGSLQSIDDPNFVDVHVGNQTDVGVETIVEYNVDAHYTNGDAIINLKLLVRNGSFEIYNFNFSSEALLK
jgi:hypothetical protein